MGTKSGQEARRSTALRPEKPFGTTSAASRPTVSGSVLIELFYKFIRLTAHKKEKYWLTIIPGHLLLFQVVYYARSLFCAQAARNLGAIWLLFWYVLRDNLVEKRWEKRLKILKTGDRRVFWVKTLVLFGCPKTEKQAFQSTIRLTVKICSKCVSRTKLRPPERHQLTLAVSFLQHYFIPIQNKLKSCPCWFSRSSHGRVPVKLKSSLISNCRVHPGLGPWLFDEWFGVLLFQRYAIAPHSSSTFQRSKWTLVIVYTAVRFCKVQKKLFLLKTPWGRQS